MNEIFVKSTIEINSTKLRQAVLAIKEHKCEHCGLTHWLDQPISLQVHHKDGDRKNNELSNLELLCLNCHSQTDTFGSKNIKKAKVSDEDLLSALTTYSTIRQALLSVGLSDGSVNYTRARSLLKKHQEINLIEKPENFKVWFCEDCGVQISPHCKRCQGCANKARTSKVAPISREVFKEKIRTQPFTHIAAEYGYSDKAIVKWCIKYNLPSKKSDIKKYTDEEWAQL